MKTGEMYYKKRACSSRT